MDKRLSAVVCEEEKRFPNSVRNAESAAVDVGEARAIEEASRCGVCCALEWGITRDARGGVCVPSCCSTQVSAPSTAT